MDTGWDQSHPSAAGCPMLLNVGMGISPGWTLVEFTVDFCCPLGQARDLCVHSHTQADSLLQTCGEAWPLPVARLMLTQLGSPK